MSKPRLDARRTLLAVLVCFIPLLCSCRRSIAVDPPQSSLPAVRPGWTEVWSDEFSGPDGSSPDPSKWTYSIGGGGWGNNELEYHTNRPANAYIEKGNLVIAALEEKYTGADGVTRNYTSARMKTQGLFTQTYGRFEARIKIPEGQGIWPAFWMLGADIPAAAWPKCGEIDIMENIGKEPSSIHGSLHGPSATAPTSDLTSTFSLPAKNSPLIFTYMPSSGNQTSSVFTLTQTYTPRSTPRTGPPGEPGSSITPSSFS